MKFIVHHIRYGYIGMEEETCYKDTDISEAALFTKESAKRLLVDINDPRIVITPMTDKQIDSLPFTLIDTQDVLDKQDTAIELEKNNSISMTANAMTFASSLIDTLNLASLEEHEPILVEDLDKLSNLDHNSIHAIAQELINETDTTTMVQI